jgi:hypothetical protein
MVFIIDPPLVERIKEMVAFAESNPLYLDDVLDMINGIKPLAGDTKGHYIIDRFGTKIVYTIEIFPDYKLRHFSISMDNGKKMPHPVIVQEIMDLLGFKAKLSKCIIEIEKRDNDPKVGILNIAELINY